MVALYFISYFTFFIEAIKANIEGISVHICNNTNKAKSNINNPVVSTIRQIIAKTNTMYFNTFVS